MGTEKDNEEIEEITCYKRLFKKHRTNLKSVEDIHVKVIYKIYFCNMYYRMNNIGITHLDTCKIHQIYNINQ